MNKTDTIHTREIHPYHIHGIQQKRELSLIFEGGIIGFGPSRHYRLTEFRNITYSPLKILVNTANPELSLVLADIADLEHMEPGLIIQNTDLPLGSPCHSQHGSGCYVIITARNEGESMLFKANLRAPIFVDYETSRAHQAILGPEHPFSMPLYELTNTINKRKNLYKF